MQDSIKMQKPADRRRLNNPHRAVVAAGAEAARKGLPVHACPYSHPAMRASWLKGFAQAQQMVLPLFEASD